MSNAIEQTARAICRSYYKQIAETGGVSFDTVCNVDTEWHEWIDEAKSALAVAVELRKSEIRKALGPQSDDPS